MGHTQLAGGSGTGLVNLTIAANTTNSPRSATLTIGGSAVVVNQSGAACNYSVTPVSLNVTGGNHSVAVTHPQAAPGPPPRTCRG